MSGVSEDDVLFGYRLRVLEYASRTSISEACRLFGIHRSTYYMWKRRAERVDLQRDLVLCTRRAQRVECPPLRATSHPRRPVFSSRRRSG